MLDSLLNPFGSNLEDGILRLFSGRLDPGIYGIYQKWIKMGHRHYCTIYVPTFQRTPYTIVHLDKSEKIEFYFLPHCIPAHGWFGASSVHHVQYFRQQQLPIKCLGDHTLKQFPPSTRTRHPLQSVVLAALFGTMDNAEWPVPFIHPQPDSFEWQPWFHGWSCLV